MKARLRSLKKRLKREKALVALCGIIAIAALIGVVGTLLHTTNWFAKALFAVAIVVLAIGLTGIILYFAKAVRRLTKKMQNADKGARIAAPQSFASNTPVMSNPELVTRANFVTPTIRRNQKAGTGIVGRLAADFESSEDVSIMLNRLIGVESDHGEKPLDELRVLGVVSQDLRVRLSTVGHYTDILPMSALAQTHPGAAFLVIEDRALRAGMWAGALGAQGTALYRELFSLLQRARANGTAVVFAKTDGAVSQFSPELSELADLTIERGHADISWAEDPDLPVVQAIVEHQLEGTR